MVTAQEQRNFLNAIKSMAIESWSASKVLPSVTAAQAALESGWGLSNLAKAPNNNLFGVKAISGQASVVMPTQEWGPNGYYTIYAHFRTYPSWAESFRSRADFFQGSEWRKNNYKAVIGETDYVKAAMALQNAPMPYATDPGYGKKLIDLINAYGLNAWDREIDKSNYENQVYGNIETMIDWFEQRRGKVGYSMDFRYGPRYYDCSSAVFNALIHAGFRPKGSLIGSTETLYSLEGTLLIPISFSEVQRGDIFVAGVKGASGWSAGHTGVYYGNGQIIHCNHADNGISVSGIAGRTGSPLYWYRLRGARTEKKQTINNNQVAQAHETIDVKSVNGGSEYIENKYLIELFGLNNKTMTFEVTDADDLKTKAEQHLEQQILSLYQFDLDAVDLSLIKTEYEDLKLYNSYLVNNELLPIHARLKVVRRSFSFSDPSIKKLTLGSRFPTSTEYALKMAQNQYIDNQLSTLSKNIRNIQTVVSNTTAFLGE